MLSPCVRLSKDILLKLISSIIVLFYCKFFKNKNNFAASCIILQLPGRRPCPVVIWPDRFDSKRSCSRARLDADPCRNRTPPTGYGGNCGCSTVGHCGRRSKAPQKEPVERFPIAHAATSGARAPHPLDVARLCPPRCRSTV